MFVILLKLLVIRILEVHANLSKCWRYTVRESLGTPALKRSRRHTRPG